MLREILVTQCSREMRGRMGQECGGGMVGVGSRRIATHAAARLLSCVKFDYSSRSVTSSCLFKVLVGFNCLCFAFGGQRHASVPHALRLRKGAAWFNTSLLALRFLRGP